MKGGQSMAIKKTNKKYYQKTPFRVIAGTLGMVMFSTMVLQSATSVKISRSVDDYKAAVNYLVDNTEYVNESGPVRVKDYIETLNTKDTLEDYYRLAGTQIAKEEYEAALKNIEKCIELYEDEEAELYTDLLLKRGCLQVLMGDYDIALKSLDLALADGAEATDIYLIKAQIYAEQEDIEALEQCLTAYLELKPEDNSMTELLAQIQLAKEDQQAPEQHYVQVSNTGSNPEIKQTNIVSEPRIQETNTASKAEIEYLYGLNAVRDSDFITGEAYLTSAIEKDDSFEGIYYYRGVCNMSLEKYTLAIKDLTLSMEKKDMLQASYYTRGVCFLMDNQYEKGIADIEYAANLNEDEEVTKQAKLLIEQLAKAKSDELEELQALEELEALEALKALEQIEAIQEPEVLEEQENS